DVPMQPGADSLLRRLRQRGLPHSVVTNSTREQAALLRRRHAVLEAVEVWVTREEYAAAKPAPDGHVQARRRLPVPAAAAIGLEDTPRGLEALLAAGVAAVLVTEIPYPEASAGGPFTVVGSLVDVPAEWI